MEPITTALIATLMTEPLKEVGSIIADKAVEFGVVAPWSARIKRQRANKREHREHDATLIAAIENALRQAGVEDAHGRVTSAWGSRLTKLIDKQHDWLRLLLAQHALIYTGSDQPLPNDLPKQLSWPEQETEALKTLLLALRAGLATDAAWRELLDYYNQQASTAHLSAINRALSNLGRLIVETEQGEALRVQLVQRGIAADQYKQLEERYREAILDTFRMHSFRGIAQFRKTLRLPLEDIYVELEMIAWHDREDVGHMEEEEADGEALARQRIEQLNKRQREGGVLAAEQRIVLLADPGAGKSMTLEYVALMLAAGQGQTRLGLDASYLPLLLPLRNFAADGKRYRSLQVYLLEYISDTFGFDSQVKEFVRLALENGHCAVLLDGLDEVGDEPGVGQLTRRQVVDHVQKFADRYCNGRRGNRLIVTSRKEGYRDAMLADVRHVEISSLRPPEEIENFLLRFYTALEQDNDAAIHAETAAERAHTTVSGLLPQIMGEDSVLLLATNPLLLTILVLIYENVGRLPNRRVKLYHICAKTLIASWQQAKLDKPSPLLQQLDEETVFNIMGRLAYWLHAHQPGGTAPIALWQTELERALRAEEVEGDLALVAEAFLNFCRFEAGLLSERGAGRFGFFHLTFEEYLAGYAIAHTDDLTEQEQMLLPHWENPRWREVILLAAGEVGIVMNSKALVRMFLDTVLALPASTPAQEGRAVVLAGRALNDIGTAAVPKKTVKRIKRRLRETMQAWDVERNRPQAAPRIAPSVRYQAGRVLDMLGWLSDDLNHWVRCAGCAENGGDLLAGKYLVTNAQFELFMEAGGYEDAELWGGEESEAWRWRVETHSSRSRGADPVTQPRYWLEGRFGRERRGFPVVGASWYEAQAYCAWLTQLTQRAKNGAVLKEEEQALVAALVSTGVGVVRLPYEEEWICMAGGDDNDRFPWDRAGQVTSLDDAETIVARANVHQSQIGQTSPVALYPQGMSVPFGLMDMSGNVWEWSQSVDKSDGIPWLRGGAWSYYAEYVRVSARIGFNDPHDSNSNIGFRVVAPVVSGS